MCALIDSLTDQRVYQLVADMYAQARLLLMTSNIQPINIEANGSSRWWDEPVRELQQKKEDGVDRRPHAVVLLYINDFAQLKEVIKVGVSWCARTCCTCSLLAKKNHELLVQIQDLYLPVTTDCCVAPRIVTSTATAIRWYRFPDGSPRLPVSVYALHHIPGSNSYQTWYGL